jgi:hypothetical protein
MRSPNNIQNIFDLHPETRQRILISFATFSTVFHLKIKLSLPDASLFKSFIVKLVEYLTDMCWNNTLT